MLTYYTSQTDGFAIRTEDTGSGNLTLELENMYTLVTSSVDLSGSYTFTPYENLLEFTTSISGSEGTEYRATIQDNDTTIWRGTIQVFGSQSIDKTEYKTQRNNYSSSISTNEYIIL
jgi:hypothetical protein